MKLEIRFERDMPCCKSTRVVIGASCSHERQLCCAWHHAGRLADAKGRRGLDAFARHLLGIWPLADVFWVFAAAGQMSTLAEICGERWRALPEGDARAAYRADLVAATLVYRAELEALNPQAFVATFDVLCEAASGRQ